MEETQDRKKGAFDVPDRETGRAGVDQLRSIAPDREWNFVEVIQILIVTSILATHHNSSFIFSS